MVRKRHVPQVALLIETSRGFGRGLIEGIVQYVREHEPWVIQFEERGLEDPPPKWLKGWPGDGIISRTATSALARAIRTTEKPLVELLRGRSIPGDIECDHDLVGRLAAADFTTRGLHDFGFFAFGNSAWIEMRKDGFLRALADCGCSCHLYKPPRQTRTVLPNWDDKQRDYIARWLRSLPKPIGIMCASDVHAMRLLESCRFCQIAVPEQIAVLGVDNDAVICSLTNPPLSSIDLNSRRIGYEAAELLSQKMSGRRFLGTVRFIPPSHIAIRQSTDTLAINDADVVQAIRFIRANAYRGIQVSHVVNEVGFSRRALERRFRQYMNRSLKKEILNVQIETAKRLLAQSSLSVEAIVHKCGFSSFKYFGQVFRREVGVTPRNYRKSRHLSSNATSDGADILPIT